MQSVSNGHERKQNPIFVDEGRSLSISSRQSVLGRNFESWKRSFGDPHLTLLDDPLPFRGSIEVELS